MDSTMSDQEPSVGGASARARWYLVQARPRQTQRAEDNLARQGYTVYHPRILVQRVRRGARIDVQESLFPNYLFIRLARWVDNWYPLRSTRGVARLVSFGRDPLPVDDGLVEQIQRRIEQTATMPAFTPGQRVEIVQGPFKGLDAIFKEQREERRVLLLIEMLQRQVCASVPFDDVRCSA